ncbi:MAG: DUF2242 domain-containing protein [Halothiobacillaceae bacterium]|nr:DUF2242 domain-containing protein [Halothiobacillaceae bacterium]
MLLRRVLFYALLVPTSAAVLGACTSQQNPTKPASVKPASPYQKQFAEDASSVCAAANRALLGDGYLTEPLVSDKLKGRKSYRVDSEHSAVVDMTVICLANPDGSSSVYANGLRTIYEMKKSSTSASVGVSVLGSLSLPIGQSADSMVKTTEETISEREFYAAFFSELESNLSDTRPKKDTNPSIP